MSLCIFILYYHCEALCDISAHERCYTNKLTYKVNWATVHQPNTSKSHSLFMCCWLASITKVSVAFYYRTIGSFLPQVVMFHSLYFALNHKKVSIYIILLFFKVHKRNNLYYIMINTLNHQNNFKNNFLTLAFYYISRNSYD